MDNFSLKESIGPDVDRYSSLHAWASLLPFDGVDFLIYPFQGQQPKNHHDHCVIDYEGMHWWIEYAAFINELPVHDKVKEIVMQNKFTFNCFLCPLNEGHIKGWSIMKRKFPHMEKALRKRYPEAKGPDRYAVLERTSQIEDAKTAAFNIYSLLLQNYSDWLKPYDPSSIPLQISFESGTKSECKNSEASSQEELILTSEKSNTGCDNTDKDHENTIGSPRNFSTQEKKETPEPDPPDPNFPKSRGEKVSDKRTNSSPSELKKGMIPRPKYPRGDTPSSVKLNDHDLNSLPREMSLPPPLTGKKTPMSPREKITNVFRKQSESPKESPRISPKGSPSLNEFKKDPPPSKKSPHKRLSSSYTDSPLRRESGKLKKTNSKKSHSRK